jgi:CheY-like chemotaxis protein
MPNILIVDDEALIPPMLGEYLNRSGYTVRSARSSLGALGWLDVETFDVAVLDVMMPGPMDGLDVCRMIRSDPLTLRTKILVISGVPEMADKAYAAGADEFLAKPFDLVEIKDLVARLAETERATPFLKSIATVRGAISQYGQHSTR